MQTVKKWAFVMTQCDIATDAAHEMLYVPDDFPGWEVDSYVSYGWDFASQSWKSLGRFGTYSEAAEVATSYHECCDSVTGDDWNKLRFPAIVFNKS